MKSKTLIKGLLLSLLIIHISCNSDKTNSTGDTAVENTTKIEESSNIDASQNTDLDGLVASMEIKNFGMNKGKTIWVNAKNITKTTHIKLDGILLESNARVPKGVVLAQLPENFTGKKKVVLELVDVANNNTSNQKNGLLSVDEVYLLKLKD